MAVLIVASVFGMVMVGLSVRANRRFMNEKRLPMQWSFSRSKSFSDSVNWSAPRILALSFTPILTIGVLILFTIGSMIFTPRPGQEGMVMPSLIFLGSVFVAAHVFHLWLIRKTLHSDRH